MKNKLIIIIVVIIISESIALVGSFLLFLHFSSLPAKLETEIENYKQNIKKDKSFFNIRADIELNGNVVNIKEDISLKDRKTCALLYVPSLNSAKTKIIKITSDTGIKSTISKDTNLEVSSKTPQSNISIEYEIELVPNSGTLSYLSGLKYLADFLITPAVYRGDKSVYTYKYPFGDPYIYNINNYYVMFKTDKDTNICAPGIKQEHIFGASKLTSFEGSKLRDFSAVLYTKADVFTEKYRGITFSFINTAASEEYVRKAFDFALRNIGDYPYNKFFIVKAPIKTQGMEFSNMIFLSDSCFSSDTELKRITYHEVFHQWFYGIIGTDQLDEPFLDEGLVNYLALELSNTKLKGSNKNNFLGKRLKDYSTREEYYSLAYNNSSAYFDSIHSKLGNNFYKLLKKIYKEKAFKTLYYKDFNSYYKKLLK